LLLLSWSFWYFFECYSLLKQCFKKGHALESAWCLFLKFKYLKLCGQCLSCFVSSLGGLILKLTLQYQVKYLWYLILWGLLHLIHLELSEDNVFANSLLGTTIQDGGIRERSVPVIVYLNSWILFLFFSLFIYFP